MTKIISGTQLAKELREEIKNEAAALREKGVEPTLAVVLVGDNKASRSYVNSKHKACIENNINSIKIELPEEISTDDLLTEIEKLNKEQQNISKLLRKKTTKNNLFALSDLEIGGMYLVSATKQNAVVLEQLKTQQAFKEFDDFEREQLEDNIIEAKQLVEMTDLHLQILRQISGTYNNVLNNNLNDTMKFLTVISILMTIPDIVTGFFGMNVQIPLTELRYGWAIILFIIALGWMGALKVIQKLLKD